MEQVIMDKIKESISEILAGLYDAVRIIEARSHKQYVITTTGEMVRQKIQCHDFWHQPKPCPNCVAKRSRQSNKIEEKVEIFGNKLFMVVGMPFADGEYCLETVKDITSLISSRDEVLHRYELLRQQLEQLSQTAYADALTGVWNRRFFDEKLPVMFHRAGHLGKSMALLMVDIDHFKKVNDTYGHINGDQVLIKVAQLLQQGVRGHDVVARYGGEEFAIMLYDVSEDVAMRVAERMREQISNLGIELGNNTIRVTISIGLAFSRDHHTPEDLLGTADLRLYKAKEMGRNRVVSE